MRKDKTWTVDLFDHASVLGSFSIEQGQNDVFWTNDTEAYLNFKPNSDSFEFTEAELTMYNKNDGSLVILDSTDGVNVENNVVSYEMQPEVIAHFGKWTVQIRFIREDNESFTSGMLEYEVKRALGDAIPERLSAMKSWDTFFTHAQETIDLIGEDELARRQAELDRQAQEEARETAEGERETAEVQRKADHANRSAEFDGKADKVILKNLVENGDFREGTTGWVFPSRINGEVINGKLHVKSDINEGQATYPTIQQVSKSTPGNIMYYRVEISETHSNSALPILQDKSTDAVLHVTTNGTHSVVRHMPSNSSLPNFYLNHILNPGQLIDYKLDNIMTIDLTETFGAGNEPTKQEMDELIDEIGYFNGTTLIPQSTILALIIQKANKKQEEWITPTLLNGATGNIQFRKNNVGRVEFRGRLIMPTSNSAAFRLPFNYTPRESIIISLYELPIGETSRRLSITSGGSFFTYGSSELEMSLGQLSFPAD